MKISVELKPWEVWGIGLLLVALVVVLVCSFAFDNELDPSLQVEQTIALLELQIQDIEGRQDRQKQLAELHKALGGSGRPLWRGSFVFTESRLRKRIEELKKRLPPE